MESHFYIHTAAEEELSIISEMAEVAFRHTYRDILSPEQMEYMMEWMYSIPNLKKQLAEGHVYHIITEDDRPCGYMSVGSEGIDDEGISIFHLHKIYILPEHQGRGLGRLLLEKAFEYARNNMTSDSARLELNVNRYNKAVDFYRHYGMTVLRQGDFHIGNGFYMNDYIMGISL